MSLFLDSSVSPETRRVFLSTPVFQDSHDGRLNAPPSSCGPSTPKPSAQDSLLGWDVHVCTHTHTLTLTSLTVSVLLVTDCVVYFIPALDSLNSAAPPSSLSSFIFLFAHHESIAVVVQFVQELALCCRDAVLTFVLEQELEVT